MFVLFTDTDNDMTFHLAKELGYRLISMPYSIDGEMFFPYQTNEPFDFKAFYRQLKEGVMPKTSALSPMDYIHYFEPVFQSGNDVLYVHFSSKMSSTFNAMALALAELKEKYPERVCHTIDTKSIAVGSLPILKEISKLYHDGKTVEEIQAWAEEEIPHFAFYLYASDLKFFQRSGRISNFSAFFGSLLRIKPIIHMDEEGYMKSIEKQRGQLPALKRLVEIVVELQDRIEEYGVTIGHTDALESAMLVRQMLWDKLGSGLTVEIVDVNPTAGSHCGPGNLGICFHAVHR